MYCQFVVHLSYATDRPGLSVGCPAGMLACFVSGFFYMVGLRLCDTLQHVITSGEIRLPKVL